LRENAYSHTWLLIYGHHNFPSYRFIFPCCATDRYRPHCFRTLRSTSSYPNWKLISIWVSEAIFCAISRERRTHKVLRPQNFAWFHVIQRQAGELQQSSTRSGSYWSMGPYYAGYGCLCARHGYEERPLVSRNTKSGGHLFHHRI
jgi:hypothetical protein